MRDQEARARALAIRQMRLGWWRSVEEGVSAMLPGLLAGRSAELLEEWRAMIWWAENTVPARSPIRPAPGAPDVYERIYYRHRDCFVADEELRRIAVQEQFLIRPLPNLVRVPQARLYNNVLGVVAVRWNCPRCRATLWTTVPARQYQDTPDLEAYRWFEAQEAIEIEFRRSALGREIAQDPGKFCLWCRGPSAPVWKHFSVPVVFSADQFAEMCAEVADEIPLARLIEQRMVRKIFGPFEIEIEKEKP